MNNKQSKDYSEFKICFGQTKRFDQVSIHCVLVAAWHEFGSIRFVLFPGKMNGSTRSIIHVYRNEKRNAWNMELQHGGKVIAGSMAEGLTEEQVISTIWRYLSTDKWPMKGVGAHG